MKKPARDSFRTKRRRQVLVYTVIAVVALNTVVALSLPSIVLMNSDVSDASIARLSDIGQAYGVASAILSAIALVVLAASIFYQARQNRYDRIVAWRDSQESLLRLVIEDPATFGPCVQDTELFTDPGQMRRYYFTTLWLSFSRASTDLGFFNQADLREEILKNMFRSPVARELWQIRRQRIIETYGSITGFLGIVDEEYGRSIASEQKTTPKADPTFRADR